MGSPGLANRRFAAGIVLKPGLLAFSLQHNASGGHAKGRPKGSNNLKTDLMAEMGQRVVVKEGDKTLRLTKQQVLIKTLSTRALNGDMKAAGTVIGLLCKANGLEDMPIDTGKLAASDKAILDAYLETVAKKGDKA